MARIRTVKPELWTDPEFVECSPRARLLFVAALNFASDYGVMADKPKQLKMQCLPGDNVNIGELITELIDAGFWLRRCAPDGAPVIVIRTFSQHQKVDKPTAGRWGDPSSWPEIPDGSPNPPRILPEPSPTEGKGREGIMEGKGKEESSSSATSSRALSTGSGDDDDFSITLEHIVKAKTRDRHPNNPRAYALTVRTNTISEDGELIRRMLKDGDTPEVVAAFVLGYGTGARTDQAAGIPWCTPDCTCDGTGWVWVDDNLGGYTACPQRKEATA